MFGRTLVPPSGRRMAAAAPYRYATGGASGYSLFTDLLQLG